MFILIHLPFYTTICAFKTCNTKQYSASGYALDRAPFRCTHRACALRSSRVLSPLRLLTGYFQSSTCYFFLLVISSYVPLLNLFWDQGHVEILMFNKPFYFHRPLLIQVTERFTSSWFLCNPVMTRAPKELWALSLWVKEQGSFWKMSSGSTFSHAYSAFNTSVGIIQHVVTELTVLGQHMSLLLLAYDKCLS